MKRFGSLILIMVLLSSDSSWSQKAFKVDIDQQKKSENLFRADGKPFARRQGEAMEPKVIIDTVRVVAGFASLSLQSTFQTGNHRTAATSPSQLYATFARILTDSTKAVYSYSYVRSAKDRITIKSSGGTADTSTVVVTLYVR